MASGSPTVLLAAMLVLLLVVVCTAATAPAATVPPTIRAQRGKPNTITSPPAVRALVQSTCNATTYYDLCVAALVADPSSSTAAQLHPGPPAADPNLRRRPSPPAGSPPASPALFPLSLFSVPSGDRRRLCAVDLAINGSG